MRGCSNRFNRLPSFRLLFICVFILLFTLLAQTATNTNFNEYTNQTNSNKMLKLLTVNLLWNHSHSDVDVDANIKLLNERATIGRSHRCCFSSHGVNGQWDLVQLIHSASLLTLNIFYRKYGIVYIVFRSSDGSVGDIHILAKALS